MNFILGIWIFLLSGCASAPYDELTESRDLMRKATMFTTMKVDTIIVEPAARGYRQLPDQGEVMLTNFSTWTSLPSTTVN